MSDNAWRCHCCTALNPKSKKSCCCCGRDESYTIGRYALPLHSIEGATTFRPSQLNKILNIEENLSYTDSSDWKLVHTLSLCGNHELLAEVLKHKKFVNVDCVNSNGQSSLHLACSSGSLPTVKLLLEHGCAINGATRFELLTPLHIACQGDWKDIATTLLDTGADVNATNVIGRSSLHLVAENGRVDLGLILINAGADRELVDAHGFTPLIIADYKGHTDFQELLLQPHPIISGSSTAIKSFPVQSWQGDGWEDLVRTNREKDDERRLQPTKDRRLKDEINLYKQRMDAIAAKRSKFFIRAKAFTSSSAVIKKNAYHVTKS